MNQTLLQICGLSVLCGLALSLTPEGSGKRVTALCCALLLLTPILRAAGAFDLSSLRLELARYREMERALSDEAEQRAENLNRRIVEEELSSFVTERAKALGLPQLDAKVTVRWDPDGFWVPDRIRIYAALSEEERGTLKESLLSELGMEDEQWEFADGPE